MTWSGKPAAIAVFTHERPSMLRQCLESYVRNLRRHGHGEINFAVWDDSRGAIAAAANRSLCASIGGAFGYCIDYAGRTERQRFCKALAGAGIPLEVAEYALVPQGDAISIGGNQNGALLESMGSAVLFVDDDTTADCARHPNYCPGLMVGGHRDPRSVLVFPTRAEAIARAGWCDIDLVSEHSALLGQTLDHCLAAATGAIEFRNPCSHLAGGRNGDTGQEPRRIVLTMPGKIGDCGSELGTWILAAIGRDEGTIASIPASVWACGGTREVHQYGRQAAVVHAISCMSGVLGLDHRALLPPFYPRFRNQDGVFGALVSCCNPHALFGLPSYAFFHAAPPGRSCYPGYNIRFSALVLAAVRECMRSSRHAVTYPAVGQRMIELAGRSASDFRETIGKILPGIHEGTERRARDLLDTSADLPEFFQKLLVDYRRTVRRIRENGDLHLPLEFRHREGDAWERVREEFLRFATLLLWWEGIGQAALELRNCGFRIAQPIARARR